jgi:hypothetical protein
MQAADLENSLVIARSNRMGIATGLAAISVAVGGWYLFIANSLTAPARGTDLYGDAVSIGAVFQAIPAILISGILVVVSARNLLPDRSMKFALLAGAAAAFAQLIALDIASRALLHSG